MEGEENERDDSSSAILGLFALGLIALLVYTSKEEAQEVKTEEVITTQEPIPPPKSPIEKYEIKLNPPTPPPSVLPLTEQEKTPIKNYEFVLYPNPPQTAISNFPPYLSQSDKGLLSMLRTQTEQEIYDLSQQPSVLSGMSLLSFLSSTTSLPLVLYLLYKGPYLIYNSFVYFFSFSYVFKIPIYAFYQLKRLFTLQENLKISTLGSAQKNIKSYKDDIKIIKDQVIDDIKKYNKELIEDFDRNVNNFKGTANEKEAYVKRLKRNLDYQLRINEENLKNLRKVEEESLDRYIPQTVFVTMGGGSMDRVENNVLIMSNVERQQNLIKIDAISEEEQLKKIKEIAKNIEKKLMSEIKIVKLPDNYVGLLRLISKRVYMTEGEVEQMKKYGKKQKKITINNDIELVKKWIKESKQYFTEEDAEDLLFFENIKIERINQMINSPELEKDFDEFLHTFQLILNRLFKKILTRLSFKQFDEKEEIDEEVEVLEIINNLSEEILIEEEKEQNANQEKKITKEENIDEEKNYKEKKIKLVKEIYSATQKTPLSTLKEYLSLFQKLLLIKKKNSKKRQQNAIDKVLKQDIQMLNTQKKIKIFLQTNAGLL